MFKRRTYVFCTVGLVLALAAPVGRPARADGGQGGLGLHRGGPGALLFRALRDVPLTDAQRPQVQQLQTTRKARLKDLLEAVAAQVEDGRVNRVALQPKLDALKASRSDLERLHAILTPAQRVQLVEAVKARMAQRSSAPRRGHPRMAALLSDLQLTDQQRALIRQALVAQFQGHRARVQGGAGKGRIHKMLEAFKGDRLVMDEVAPPRAKADQKVVTHLDGRLGALLPILTPQQRAKLAQRIRAHVAPANEPAPTSR